MGIDSTLTVSGSRCFSPRAQGPKGPLFKGPWAQDVSLRGPLGPRCFSPRSLGPRFLSWGLLARARGRGRGRGRARAIGRGRGTWKMEEGREKREEEEEEGEGEEEDEDLFESYITNGTHPPAPPDI